MAAKKPTFSALAHDPAAIARDLQWRLGDLKTTHEDAPTAVLCAAAWACEAFNFTAEQEAEFLRVLGLRWTRTPMGALVLTDKPPAPSGMTGAKFRRTFGTALD